MLIEQIELKYVNKVLNDVGLGIAFFDFLYIGEPYLYPGAGSAIRLGRFRIVMFRPFVGEVMTGHVVEANKDGIKVSLDFFEDIFISGSHMQNPSSFDSSSGLWVWHYNYSQSSAANEVTDEQNQQVEQFAIGVNDKVSFINSFLFS